VAEVVPRRRPLASDLDGLVMGGGERFGLLDESVPGVLAELAELVRRIEVAG
jgi:hypothetical protein